MYVWMDACRNLYMSWDSLTMGCFMMFFMYVYGDISNMVIPCS